MQRSNAMQAPNYTQLPNDIVDNYLEDLTGSEVKILLVVARKTIGYHKEVDSISSSQIVHFTGMNRDTVWKGISGLEEKGLLVVDRSGVGKMNKYTLNVDPSQKSDRSSNVSDFSDTENLDTGKTVYRKSDTQKKTSTKENQTQKKTNTKVRFFSNEEKSPDLEEKSEEKSSSKSEAKTQIKDISVTELQIVDEDLIKLSDFLGIDKDELRGNIVKSNWLCELMYQSDKRRRMTSPNAYAYKNLKIGTKKILDENPDLSIEGAILIIMSVLNDAFWSSKPLSIGNWGHYVGLAQKTIKEKKRWDDDW